MPAHLCGGRVCDGCRSSLETSVAANSTDRLKHSCDNFDPTSYCERCGASGRLCLRRGQVSPKGGKKSCQGRAGAFAAEWGRLEA